MESDAASELRKRKREEYEMQLFGFHSRVVYATSKSPSAFYISMCNAFSDRTFRRTLDGQEFWRGHRPLGVTASPASRQNLVAAGRVYSSFMWHSIMTRVTLVQRPGHFQRIFHFFSRGQDANTKSCIYKQCWSTKTHCPKQIIHYCLQSHW